jgi:hypothetical protein
MTELERAEKLTENQARARHSTAPSSPIHLKDVKLMRTLEASAERNHQSVDDCATFDITQDGSAAIRILGQFCKRAHHLLRPLYGAGGRIFGVQRDTHRDVSIVIIRHCDSHMN